MKLKILAVLVLVVVGVGATIFALGGISTGQAATTDYLTSPATTGDVTDQVAATGTLAAQERYGLVFGADPYLVTADSTAPTSQTTYHVKEVKAKVGDAVKKGDVLATADTTDLRRQLTAAQNTLASAQVSLRSAKSTLSDAKDADVTEQIRQAKIGVYNAENQVATAKQDVADLKTQIAAATLKAPIDGVVTESDITAGFDAPSGTALIIDSTGFEVTTDVVESDLANVKLGQAASVSVSAVDAVLDGKVTAISPVASSSSSGGSSAVSYPVTVELASAPASMRSGMTADVTITIASANGVLTVPAEALRGTAGDYSVLLLGTDGTPQRQAVEVGLVTNTTAEIKRGLTEGQEVVTGTASARNGNSNATSGGFGFPGAAPGGVVREFRNSNGGNGNNRNSNGGN
jgi:macrolide-specific efflux system membrane fusion protein